MQCLPRCIDIIRSDKYEDTSTLIFGYVLGRIPGKSQCVNAIGQKYQGSNRIDREYKPALKFANCIDKGNSSGYFGYENFKRG